MNVSVYLGKATMQLREAGIESARLDSMILLEDALGKDRSWLLAHPEYKLRPPQLSALEVSIARRTHHEPLAYIRNKAGFYGREFYVDVHVLVPRPETESFIDLFKKHLLNTNNTRLLDLGTGSGCIGITAALECPDLQVTLADTDLGALQIARKNAASLGVKATFTASDLLSTIGSQFDVIMTNLPYVPEGYPVNKPVHFEPALALYAGTDGMDLYRNFWQQVRTLKQRPSVIIAESLLQQHGLQTQFAELAGYALGDTLGLVQFFER